jgi:hypothetical protein
MQPEKVISQRVLSGSGCSPLSSPKRHGNGLKYSSTLAHEYTTAAIRGVVFDAVPRSICSNGFAALSLNAFADEHLPRKTWHVAQSLRRS